jgi:hypothetical protein
LLKFEYENIIVLVCLAAITKYHSLDEFNSGNSFSHSFGGRRSDSRVLVELLSGKACLLDL